MDRVFDRIVIRVPELAAAADEYSALLGARPHASGEAARWCLANTVIELRPGAERACIGGLVLGGAAAGADERGVANTLGIDLSVGDGSLTAAARQAVGTGHAGLPSVDHLVLRTGDAQACLDLFATDLGIRLALDKTVPEWGGRMLFFRAGKMTLEVIASEGDDDATSRGFWGIAYQCRNLQELAATLAARGVSLSSIRDGRKPGTLVATVKSHCLDIPTLLIQPVT